MTLRQATAAVQQAKAQRDVQRGNINSANAQRLAWNADTASAEAAIRLAPIDIDNTVIHAPEDGWLGQVSARVRQYVTAGTVLISHAGQNVWVIANFTGTGLHTMRVGQLGTVDAMGGRLFNGRVEAYSPATASEFNLLAAKGNFTRIAQRLPVRRPSIRGRREANGCQRGYRVWCGWTSLLPVPEVEST